MRCAGCHIVVPNKCRDVTDAASFEVIARKFATSLETLAFSLLDPHPRMVVPLTRREAQSRAHCCGLVLFGGEVREMTVLQLKQEKVSKFALFSSDLLLIIAIPHSGQGRGRGKTDI